MLKLLVFVTYLQVDEIIPSIRYLTGIELGKQGSNVFNVIWRSTADIQMASHVDRVMRDRAVSRKRRFRIRC